MATDTVKTKAISFPTAGEQHVMLALRGRSLKIADLQLVLDMSSGPASTASLLKSLRTRGLVDRRGQGVFTYFLTPFGAELADFIIQHGN